MLLQINPLKIKCRFAFLICFNFCLLLWTYNSFAEEDSDLQELNIIELEIEKGQQKKVEEKKPLSEKNSNDANKNMDYSGLGNLSPFSEISVIQKRYLPKTYRVQLFGGMSMITNDPFFTTTGWTGRVSFFLSEDWGIEGSYMSLGTSDREATKDLRTIQNVKTDGLVYPKSYSGLDLVWVPIYGKMTYFNKKIVPFDLYFSLGYGTTETKANDKVGTWHIGTGQIFALSKAFALRWDFSWNSYSAKGIESYSTSGTEDSNTYSTFNNLFINLGASFFIPEAKYR